MNYFYEKYLKEKMNEDFDNEIFNDLSFNEIGITQISTYATPSDESVLTYEKLKEIIEQIESLPKPYGYFIFKVYENNRFLSEDKYYIAPHILLDNETNEKYRYIIVYEETIRNLPIKELIIHDSYPPRGHIHEVIGLKIPIYEKELFEDPGKYFERNQDKI